MKVRTNIYMTETQSIQGTIQEARLFNGRADQKGSDG